MQGGLLFDMRDHFCAESTSSTVLHIGIESKVLSRDIISVKYEYYVRSRCRCEKRGSWYSFTPALWLDRWEAVVIIITSWRSRVYAAFVKDKKCPTWHFHFTCFEMESQPELKQGIHQRCHLADVLVGN